MKTLKFFAVLLLIGVLAVGCGSSRSFERGVQGGLLGTGIGYIAGKGPGAVAGGLIGGSVGSIVGTFESDRGVPGKSHYSSPPPPPPQRLSSASPSHPPVLPWQGVKVAVSDRGGRGDEASVRGTVIDALRSWGAEVIVISGHGSQSGDAPYVLEIQTRSEGNRAVVDLWFFERATRAVRLHGRAAEFYYDGSDRWRSFQWATSRALANLR